MPNFTFLPQIIFEGVVIGLFSGVAIETVFKIRRTPSALSSKLSFWLILYVVAMIVGFLSQINRQIFELALFPLIYTDIAKFNYLILIPVANFIAYRYYIDFYRILFNRERKIRSFFILTCFVLGFSFLFMVFPHYGYIGNIIIVFHSLYLYLPSFLRCADDFSKFGDSSEIINEKQRIQQIEQELETRDIDVLRYSLLSRAVVYLCFLVYALFFIFDGIWDYLTGGYYGPFFYFAWITMLVCTLFIYFAFVNPARFLSLLKKYRVFMQL